MTTFLNNPMKMRKNARLASMRRGSCRSRSCGKNSAARQLPATPEDRADDGPVEDRRGGDEEDEAPVPVAVEEVRRRDHEQLPAVPLRHEDPTQRQDDHQEDRERDGGEEHPCPRRRFCPGGSVSHLARSKGDLPRGCVGVSLRNAQCGGAYAAPRGAAAAISDRRWASCRGSPCCDG